MTRMESWTAHFVCCLFFLSCPAGAQELPLARVDERVELISIVFRLAGSPEYSMTPLKSYAQDVDSYFGPFKAEPAVLLARNLIQTRDLGFDGVMQMAISLGPPPGFSPFTPFTAANTDKRWGEESATAFPKELAQFYRDSHFRTFFNSHRLLYQTAEERFAAVTKAANLAWFDSFFGEHALDQFRVVIGMNNGGGNYGPKIGVPGSGQVLYAIIGAGTVDADGRPVFSKEDYVPLVIHEFSHSYVNPIVAAHLPQMSGLTTLFLLVQEQMQAQAYSTPETLADESLVRAFVIVHGIDSGDTQTTTEQAIHAEEGRGFLWMGDLVALMQGYEHSRNAFANFDAYMPVITRFFNDQPKKFPAEKDRFDKASAHVSAISPLSPGVLVDPSTKQLIVHFDKEMQPGQYSINYGPGGKEHFPLEGTPRFVNGNKELILPVHLREDETYGFVLTSEAFRSINGYPLAISSVTFQTGIRNP